MKNLIFILPLALMTGCGDSDEDTGSEDTGADTAAAAEAE